MDHTPASLLERLRQPLAGGAWERFILLYTPLLNRFAYRLGLQGEDAEDLVQDVFALLVRKLPEFDYNHLKSFRGWLWTITLNQYRQNQRRHTATPARHDANMELLVAPLNGSDVERDEYNRWLIQRAMSLLEKEFQPATWQACWQLVVEDQSAAEVAARLSLSVAAVYSAKARVLRRLRRELAGLVDGWQESF
ncbi:MAG: sigma-70 family RNA polymerase sigma factor, partial [Gemmataceae bacterium]